MQSATRIPGFTGLRAAVVAPRVAAKKMAVQRQQVAVRASVVAEPVALDVKTLDGAAAGTASLSLKVADSNASKGLVHRYLVMVRQNMRRGTASTLTRSEVRGGGRKPYKQKGTGNARRGSKRSPLMPGGGISFGPKPRDWSISMNKKEKRLALATAVQSAAADMVVVDDLAGALPAAKTSALLEKLAALGASPSDGVKTLIILSEASQNVYLSGRNVDKLAINTANAVQVYDVLAADRIVIEKAALAYINEYYGASDE